MRRPCIIIASALLLLATTAQAQSEDPDPLTPEQRAYLEDHGPIVIGVLDDGRPFSYDDNGTFRGWDVELVQLAALEAGVDVTFVGGAGNVQEAVQRLADDEVDATGMWGDRPDLQAFGTRTGDWAAVAFLVVMGPDAHEIDRLAEGSGRISAPTGSIAQRTIEAEHPQWAFVETPDLAAGVQQVLDGTIDAYVGPIGAIGEQLQEHRADGLHALPEPLLEIPTGLWVRQEDDALAGILATMESLMEERERALIQFKWTGVYPQEDAARRQTVIDVPAWLAPVGALAAVSFVSVLAAVVVLRRRVGRRTDELARLNAALDDRIERRTRELESARFRMTQILHAAGEGIVGLDGEGGIRFCNPAAVKALGYRFEGELFGRDAHGVLHGLAPDGSDHEPEACPLHATLVQGEVAAVPQDTFWTRDGDAIPVEYTLAPVLVDSETHGAVIVFRDIQERLVAERAIRDSEEAFRAMASSAVDAIVAAGSDGRIVFANEAAHDVFAWSPGSLEGRPLTALIPEDLRDAHRAGFKRYLDTGQGEIVGSTVELEAQRADGGRFPIALSLSAAKRRGETLFTAIIRDLSDEKERQDALERSNRDLEAYASMASHDLQAPLRHVQGFAEILETKSEQLDEEGQAFLARMVQSVQRMQAIIDSLLSFSRLSSREPEWTDVDLDAVVRDVADVVERPLAEADGTLAHDPLPTIRGDQHRLFQMFQNLVQNSIRYRDPERPLRIRVTYEATDDAHRICVIDNGQGFEPEYAERIFGMFQRLQEKSKAGVGLGLAIVRRIIEQHGGTIQAEPSPGKGATFIIELPLTPA